MKIMNRKVIRPITVSSAAFLIFASSGYAIGMSQESSVNNFLNIDVTGKGNIDENAIYFPSSYTSEEDLKKDTDALPESVMEEGAVLLKNDNKALPLKKEEKISLFGQGCITPAYSASGSSATTGVDFETPKEVLEARGFSVNPTLDTFYSSMKNAGYGRNQGYDSVGGIIRLINECPYSKYTTEAINSISQYGDVALYILSRDAGEGMDVNCGYADGKDGSYLSLSEEEISVFKGLASLKQEGKIKKIVVLMNSAVPIRSDFLFDEAYSIDACMWTGCFGSKGLYGVADLLLGNNAPSGKLTDTFLKDNFASPVMATWSKADGMSYAQIYTNYRSLKLNTTQRYYGVDAEGIYVGYRYYETRYEDFVKRRSNVGEFNYSDIVSFPFGYGLSYTTFQYTNFTVTPSSDALSYEVSVTVKNTGDVEGKNAVQIYLQKPYSDYDIQNGVEKSSVELVGFAKTNSIKPYEEETVKITVDKSQFKSYDSNKAKTYILDQGDYRLTVGKNSHDAINNFLAKDGKTISDGMTENGNKDLVQTALSQASLDVETYSVSTHTGNKITNQLDFMDMNKYENRGDNSITYVSRNNWIGTYPTSAITFTANENMKSDLASHKKIVEEDGVTMPNYSLNNGYKLADLRGKDYDDDMWDDLLDQMSFGEQSKLVTNGAFSTDAVVSISKPGTLDQDGPTGIIKTKTGLVLPSLAIWASSYDKNLLAKIGDIMAEDVRNCGYHTLYAPGVNIHRSQFGGRLNEYFSEDPYLTGVSAGEVISSSQKKGVLMTIKHYAFNEEEAQRNGICVWMNEQEAREIMLKPFEIVMSNDGYKGHTFMTSFNRAGCIWTGASSNLLNTINRDEWGFDGYSVTDMASGNGALYMTFDDAFMNGTELFLGSGSETSLDDYSSSITFRNKIREASKRILYTIGNYSAAMNGYSSNISVKINTPWWQVTLIALIAVSATISGLGVIAWILSYLPYFEKH